jgi:two-component system chemotaxis response regulator CheB
MEQLPPSLALSVLVVMHISPEHPNILARLLNRVSQYEVEQACDGMTLASGHAYVAPPNHHMTLVKQQIRLTSGPREQRVRPSANPLFRSTARWYGTRAIGLVLSGMRSDGASGLAEIHRRGGRALVQDPKNADFAPMPEAAIRADQPDLIGTPGEIVDAIVEAARANLRGEAAYQDDDRAEDTATPGADNATWREENEDSQPGRLTSLRCPDCRGSHSEQKENSGFRYHCRIGHSFSTVDLDEAQQDDLEGALWGAVVALEERAEFLRGIQSRMGDRVHQRMSDEIAEKELQATTLRRLISSGFAARAMASVPEGRTRR